MTKAIITIEREIHGSPQEIRVGVSGVWFKGEAETRLNPGWPAEWQDVRATIISADGETLHNGDEIKLATDETKRAIDALHLAGKEESSAAEYDRAERHFFGDHEE